MDSPQVVKSKKLKGTHYPTARQIDAFSIMYGVSYATLMPQIASQRLDARRLVEEGTPLIDWRRVAESYQGIVIAPYVWARRHHLASGWYYAWDCASGCIWDSAAVAAIMPQ